VRLPRDLTGNQVIKALQRLGFQITRQVGSHVRLSKEQLRVTVPLHHSVAPGTLRSILRQAGITLGRFLETLR
jgi:predicted RNA binding protein YcfA (HicA-like mRNA interferase family)